MSVLPTMTDQLFNLDNVKIITSLDEQHVMYPADFLTAVVFVVSFLLVFDVVFPKQTKTVALLLATSAS